MSNKEKSYLSKAFNKVAAIGAAAIVLSAGMLAFESTASASSVSRADREALRYNEQICKKEFDSKYINLKDAWDNGRRSYNYNDYLKIRNKYTKCINNTAKKSWTPRELKQQNRKWEKAQLLKIRAEGKARLRQARKIKNRDERRDEIKFIKDQSYRDKREIEQEARVDKRKIERFENYGGTSISKWGPFTIRSYSGNGRYNNYRHGYNNNRHSYSNNRHRSGGGAGFHWRIGNH